MSFSPLAYPLAQQHVAFDIYKFIQRALPHDKVRRGASETIKALKRGDVGLVVLAADCDPIDIILHIPPICEQCDVAYVFVPSQHILGRASDISSNVISVCVLRGRHDLDME
ncbi:putative multi-domain containing protein, partial [Aduncisulcus paluster]